MHKHANGRHTRERALLFTVLRQLRGSGSTLGVVDTLPGQ